MSKDLPENESNKDNLISIEETTFVIEPKNHNYWKIAFLILLGLLLGFCLFVYTRVTTSREPKFENLLPETTIVEGSPILEVVFTKRQLNDVIDYTLDEFLNDSTVEYQFYLENQALLKGIFPFLGKDIQFYMYFDPYVLKNGDIELQATSLSLGTLSLPMVEVLNYVEKSYELPYWVEVEAKKHKITLHLNQFVLDNGMFFRAEKINLVDDDIRLTLYWTKDESSFENTDISSIGGK